ncbi:MAG: hypothetical protein AAGA44_16665 [Pseudomonadota bacterium]
MIRPLIRLLMLLPLIAGAPAALGCDYPARVDIPNGASADRDTMLNAQAAVKEYVTSMEAYLECIVNEENNARAQMVDLAPEDEQQREDLLTKRYNAAVEEMERIAAEFNVEVQAFRDRGQ